VADLVLGKRLSEAGEWVLGEVRVTQGDIDSVRALGRFVTQAGAEEAAVERKEEGHPWSGLTTYRVLRSREPGIYLLPDETPYYPKGDYGF
jgi:hypothetical protein